MKTVFVEATNGFNWGKFLLARFDEEEWERASTVGTSRSLLDQRGWTPAHLLFLDIETGEGCVLLPGGSASADLDKHRVWVCPLAEPFLEWLYDQETYDLDSLPPVVELPKAPAAMQGYRRGESPSISMDSIFPEAEYKAWLKAVRESRERPDNDTIST